MFLNLLHVFIFISVVNTSELNNELTHCTEQENAGLVFVSTLDGKFSAVTVEGILKWEMDTGPGPLLLSNIHKLELTNNGEWIRIIPSLSGALYKFDGVTIDPIPISADSLLKSSFRYSDDLVIAGSMEVRTYGVGFRSGKIFYECTPIKCLNKDKIMDDVLLIERTTQTIRAVEPRSGYERWNFSVGLNNIKLSKVSCADSTILFDWNLTAVLPEGLLRASKVKDNSEQSWQYQFNSPIVNVWRWDGNKLIEINLFSPKNIPNVILSENTLPVIYVGMHNKQLYVHESAKMHNILQGKIINTLAVAESNSLAKIPWNPVSASDRNSEDDSTALSVLHSSEYVNGNGYYLYSEIDLDKKELLCEKNETFSNLVVAEQEFGWKVRFNSMVSSFLSYKREVIIILVTTIIFNMVYRFWQNRNFPQRIVYVETPKLALPVVERNTCRESESEQFYSRYLSDFDTIQCLGQGGFGVVFEVKQKIDECHYAIKRIELPNAEKPKDRVMREVKALAKLDHENIVRYFCSWVECPPLKWTLDYEQQWLPETSSRLENSVLIALRGRRSKSVSIDLNDDLCCSRSNYPIDESNDDSFIVFEKDSCTKTETNATNSTFLTHSNQFSSYNGSSATSDHFARKVNWRRPSRKHHSLDMNDSLLDAKYDVEPPVFLYIQMQLCKKQSLKEWLIENPKRDHHSILDIFLQILNAVEYVHLRGLIHRDLKPSNIFFALDGKIKVGDFGLVKDIADKFEFESKNSLFSSRKSHTLDVGTMLYMSPEQLKRRNYDYKVDIFSLGVIFFELLVSFSTDMERIKMITDARNQQYPQNFHKNFPDEYNLLQQMLCEDPTQRLTAIGIKAKPPYAIKDANFNKDAFFHLPQFSEKL